MKFELSRTGGYLVSESDRVYIPTSDIVIRDPNWKVLQVVHEDSDNDTIDVGPRVDTFGRYVAWTRGVARGYDCGSCIAVKEIDGLGDGEMVLLGQQFETAIFCGWTTDDKLLAQVQEGGKLKMVILDLAGNVVKEVPTPFGLRQLDPWPIYAPAEFRNRR